jgi:hypothetical protein
MAKKSTGDTIAVLYPFDQLRGCRSNAHSGKAYGRSKDHDVAYAKHKYFHIESASFSDVRRYRPEAGGASG